MHQSSLPLPLIPTRSQQKVNDPATMNENEQSHMEALTIIPNQQVTHNLASSYTKSQRKVFPLTAPIDHDHQSPQQYKQSSKPIHQMEKSIKEKIWNKKLSSNLLNERKMYAQDQSDMPCLPLE